MAKTYKAKTKDDEVSDKADVEVEESEDVVRQRVYTLAEIDGKIASLQSQIDALQAIRLEVDAEADKVKLKDD